MILKLFGVVCILCACGYTGFTMAGNCIAASKAMSQLDRSLEMIICQMEYRMTELPELCDILISACSGPVREFYRELGKELQTSGVGDISVATALAVERTAKLPTQCKEIITDLGKSLGGSDLHGELRQLEYARSQIRALRQEFEQGLPGRVKSYRALGLCGGAALAILLL